MIDKNKQYQTRDGREVKIYDIYDQDGACVHGATQQINGRWITCSWHENGQISMGGPHFSDLIEVKPKLKIKGFVTVYRSASGILGLGTIRGNKQESKEKKASGCIACIPIELDFEEGEGLD